MSRPNATVVTERRLRQETLAFAGTNGVSKHACRARFLPAFRDPETGRVEIARFKSGAPAPMHLLVGLPDEWAIQHDDSGQITALKPGIVAGFVRDDRFYTREQAACLA